MNGLLKICFEYEQAFVTF